MPIGGVQFEDEDDYMSPVNQELFQEEPRVQFARLYSSTTLLTATGPAYTLEQISEMNNSGYRYRGVEINGKNYLAIIDWDAITDFLLQRSPKKWERVFPNGEDGSLSFSMYDFKSIENLPQYEFKYMRVKDSIEYAVHYRLVPDASKKKKSKVNTNPILLIVKTAVAQEAARKIFAKYPVSNWKVGIRSNKSCDSIRDMSALLGIEIDLQNYNDHFDGYTSVTPEIKTELLTKLKEWWNTTPEAKPKEGNT